jgi:prepilin-type N-terminal cleavage/methylation domain-containing protein
MRIKRTTRGFSLIECLAYLAVLGVVMGMAFTAFFRVQENSLDLRRNADDILRATRLGERWREDIRLATARPFIAANGAWVEFVIPQEQGAVKYAFSNGTVWRKPADRDKTVAVMKGVKDSRMELDARQRVNAWRWELELASKQKDPRVKPLFSFLAVGGKPE